MNIAPFDGPISCANFSIDENSKGQIAHSYQEHKKTYSILQSV